MMDYQARRFEHSRHDEQDTAVPVRHPVVIVGAGPAGMTLALDLAQQGIRVVLLDDDNKLSAGSRAICFAKRTLEIFDRLGVGDEMIAKGVSWNVGKVFCKEDHVYTFNLLCEDGHQRPAFVNLQQYYVEGYLCDAVMLQPNIAVCWKNKVIAVDNRADGVALTVESANGTYALIADYVIACDGSRSSVRQALGLESRGQTFRDRFLIADVKMTAPFPTERWFWFDPPFHPNQSVLLHKQPDNVWRIDFQLGWDADPEEEKKPERVRPRVQALLGAETEFELEWISVYTFACMRMEKFRHGRVLFAGDSAHLVSPFGARGANSGIQDVDNLAWKLVRVLGGEAPDRLLDTYASEREFAADENILNSTRATDFITPKSEISKLFRDAVLTLAKEHPFARRIVNSGRLSTPATLDESPLNTSDADQFSGAMVPGAPAVDAPVSIDGIKAWFLPCLGEKFICVTLGSSNELCFARSPLKGKGWGEGDGGLASTAGAPSDHLRLPGPRSSVGRAVQIIASPEWIARYDARRGTTYLFRPDQHVCARWRQYDETAVRTAIAHATCND